MSVEKGQELRLLNHYFIKLFTDSYSNIKY